jgi:aldose 1-epimerase
MNMQKINFIILAIIALFVGCKNQTEKEKTKIYHKIEKSAFGNLADGSSTDLYTLKNEAGTTVKISNYGGIITYWTAPDKNGVYEDVVLGYDSVKAYVDNSPYFGAIIGRYGNRISKGKFELNGKSYTLATNNEPNHLHGGVKGFDKVIWSATPKEGEEPSLKLTYTSKDGEEGYPGTLTSTVVYTLKKDNSLVMDFMATTDTTTIVNLCNHSYFNLSGNKDVITDHELTLHAPKFCVVDKGLIPTGELRDVKNTPFDFTAPRLIGKSINDTIDEQIRFGLGYDHCWVLANQDGSLKLAATLSHQASGRKMDVYTTEPGIQFYSGNFLDGKIIGKGGIAYPYRFGLCLETQHYPDSPNQKDFPSVILKKGDIYKSQTVHRFYNY